METMYDKTVRLGVKVGYQIGGYFHRHHGLVTFVLVAHFQGQLDLQFCTMLRVYRRKVSAPRAASIMMDGMTAKGKCVV